MNIEDLQDLADDSTWVKFACSCGKRVRSPRAGAIVRCPKCDRILKTPGATTTSAPAVRPPRRAIGPWAGAAGLLAGGLIGGWAAYGAAKEAFGLAEGTALAIGAAAGAAALWALRAAANAVRVRRKHARILAEASALKDAGDELYNRRLFAEAKEKYETALARLAEFPGRCHVLQGVLEELLRSDDIKYGADPNYRYVNGKWVLHVADEEK